MKRKIIEIDEKICNGCGECIPNCPEGALQIIDGKARLISDLFCDGLGACIGDCPLGAISVTEREAEPYDENKVMENIIKAGPNTIKAHLKHLEDHNEQNLLSQAIEILQQKGITVPRFKGAPSCPALKNQIINQDNDETNKEVNSKINIKSELKQWPIQLHLINPLMPFLNNADLLFAADCAPFAYANFHRDFIRGKIVINFCPKLDKNIENYITKLTQIFKEKDINSISIVRMEVPCCGGMEMIIKEALKNAEKSIEIKKVIISIQGKIL